MSNSAPLALLDESQIKDLIYEVRGQKVMLDFDLARIYGYETRYFNRQVKNNADRFDNDFTFQPTREEWAEILKCKNFTANSVFCRRKCAKWRFEVEKIGIKLGRKKEFAARVYRSGHPIELSISGRVEKHGKWIRVRENESERDLANCAVLVAKSNIETLYLSIERKHEYIIA